MSRGLVNKSTGERIPSAPGYIVDKVGDLSALHTTAKDKAVSAINEVADAVNAVESALADKTDTDMVAADFNAGTSYTAGNYCVQNGKLYRFKNNHSGAWSASDVEEVKITGELATLKSGLTNLGDLSLVYVMANSMSDGQHYYIDLSRFTISGERCPIIVMSGSQGSGAKITLGLQNNGGFSFPADSGITWDSTNKKIEVDEGSSAWTIPYLIIPKKIIS